MNGSFIKTVILSAYRRRRSMWKVALISFLCVFLFGGIMIFQDVMNRFQRGNALKEGGDWFAVSTEQSELIREHAYFDRESYMAIRTSAYHASNGGYNRAGKIGTADQAFFQMSNMKLLAGRLPETADEIAVTRQGLSNLASSFTVGQEIMLTYDTQKRNSAGKPVYNAKQVTITGILPSYRENWIDDIEFPDFFLTEQGLQSLHVIVPETRYYFYSLGAGHMDVDGTRLFGGLEDMLAKEGYHNILVYNRASYDVTMWGSQNMYYMAMLLCAILGSMSLIYLFSGCLHDRRSIYFRYLELGVTRGQLRGMVALEWLAVFFPSACVALCFSLLFTGIGANILSQKYDIPHIFYVSGRSLLMILLFTFGVFLLVLLWCCLGFRVKGLHEMTGQMPVKRLKHLRRRGDDRFGGLALFQRRRGRMYPGKALVRILFTVVALSMVLYMSLLWRERYQEDRIAMREADIVGGVYFEGGSALSVGTATDDGRLANAWPNNPARDKNLSREEEEERRTEIPGLVNLSVDYVRLSSGLTQEQREELDNIPGVKKVLAQSLAKDMKLVWDNCQHSDFRNNRYIQEALADDYVGLLEGAVQPTLAPGEYNKAHSYIPEDLSLYEHTVYGLEKSEAVERELRGIGKQYDSDAFWAGEQGILFAIQDEEIDPEYEPIERLQGFLSYDKEKGAYRFQGREGEKYQYSLRENTVQSGDEIRILDSEKEELLSTEVVVSTDRDCYRRILESGAEMYTEDHSYNEFDLTSFQGGYFLMGSQNMMKKIQEKRGEPLTCHRLNIWLEDGANRVQTEKKVTKFFSKYDLEYHSNLEAKSTTRSALNRQRMISVTVILLVVFCYFYIMQNMERKEMEQMKRQLQLLLQQGAWKRDLMKVRGRFHFRGYLWGILSIPLCCLWQGIGRWSSILVSSEEEESLTEGGVDWLAFGKELLADWGNYLRQFWMWGIFLLFVVMVVAFTLLAEWRYLKRLKLFE